MPKIIPDLGSRILETAFRHFEAKGFGRTDMKSLAADVGISVGTLYNYFPSKNDLFLEVSAHWKRELSHRMIARLDRDDGANEKLRDTLLMLFDDMVSFTGIWREYQNSGATFRPGTPHGDRFRRDNEQLNQRIQELFREVWKNHPGARAILDDDQGRVGQLMVGSIMQLVMNGGGTPGEHREFVVRWLDFVVPPGKSA